MYCLNTDKANVEVYLDNRKYTWEDASNSHDWGEIKLTAMWNDFAKIKVEFNLPPKSDGVLL